MPQGNSRIPADRRDIGTARSLWVTGERTEIRPRENSLPTVAGGGLRTPPWGSPHLKTDRRSVSDPPRSMGAAPKRRGSKETGGDDEIREKVLPARVRGGCRLRRSFPQQVRPAAPLRAGPRVDRPPGPGGTRRAGGEMARRGGGGEGARGKGRPGGGA